MPTLLEKIQDALTDLQLPDGEPLPLDDAEVQEVFGLVDTFIEDLTETERDDLPEDLRLEVATQQLHVPDEPGLIEDSSSEPQETLKLIEAESSSVAPAVTSLVDTLAALANELDLTPSEVAAVKRQYEESLDHGTS